MCDLSAPEDYALTHFRHCGCPQGGGYLFIARMAANSAVVGSALPARALPRSCPRSGQLYCELSPANCVKYTLGGKHRFRGKLTLNITPVPRDAHTQKGRLRVSDNLS